MPSHIANSSIGRMSTPRNDVTIPQGSLTENLGETAEFDHIFLVEDQIKKTYHKNIDRWSYPIINPAIQDPNVRETFE